MPTPIPSDHQEVANDSIAHPSGSPTRTEKMICTNHQNDSLALHEVTAQYAHRKDDLCNMTEWLVSTALR